MITLTEARKVTLALSQFAATLPQSLNFISFNIATINAYLDSQVAESQEVVELRARLARAETYMVRSRRLLNEAFGPLDPSTGDENVADRLGMTGANMQSFGRGVRDTVKAGDLRIPLGFEMTKKACGNSYAHFVANHWKNHELIAHGYMRQIAGHDELEKLTPELLAKLRNGRDMTGRSGVDPSQMEDGAIGRPG